MKATNLTDLSTLETESCGTLLKTPADAPLPAALHKIIGIWTAPDRCSIAKERSTSTLNFFTALNGSAYMIHRNQLTARM